MISTSWYLLKQLCTSFHWAPKTVSEQWLISQPCHIHSTSFKADRGRKLLFQIKKTEGKLEISRSLNFYNASLNYAAICLLFICVLLLFMALPLKKACKMGAGPACCVNTFSPRIAYWRNLSFNVDFIFYTDVCFRSCVPVRDAPEIIIPVDKLLCLWIMSLNKQRGQIVTTPEEETRTWCHRVNSIIRKTRDKV